MIDFTLTPEQKQIQQGSALFASNVLANASKIYSGLSTQRQRFQSTRPLYQAAVQHAQIKAQIPVPLGGLNASLVDAAIALEEMYAVDPSVTLTIAATGLGLTPLVLGGTPEQHKKFLKPFLSGEGDPIASLVHSEPGGTANWLEKGAKGLQTTVRRESDFWIINGEKLWTTNSAGWDGKGADIQCVVCRVIQGEDSQQDASADPRSSIMILIVTRNIVAQNDAAAYTVLEEPELMGHIACSGPRTQFKSFKVPDGIHVLAGPESGAALIEQSFGCSAALVGAFATSIMRHTFEAAMKFAKTDTRGGSVPILQHQSVSNILMDIKMRTDVSRLLTWKALHCMQNGPGDFKARLELCLEAKIFCSENAVTSVIDAMRAVGITSYRADQPFSGWLNDAAVLPIFDGGNVGIRRRQIEKIYLDEAYAPWSAI